LHRSGTKHATTCYFAMKKTTRKPLNRMTIFVVSIFILAIMVAAIYLIGFTPGET
jgi:preprotein translocase subunit SecG